MADEQNEMNRMENSALKEQLKRLDGKVSGARAAATEAATESYWRWKSRFRDFASLIDARIYGEENLLEGRGILAPNHADWKDIPIIEGLMGRTIYWLGNRNLVEEKKEKRIDTYWHFLKHKYSKEMHVRTKGFYDWLARACSAVSMKVINGSGVFIPVDMGGNGSNRTAIQKVIGHLKRDNLVAWFPAGHIFPDTEIAPFKDGVAETLYLYGAASDAGESANGLTPAPVYPVAVKNTRRLFSPGVPVSVSIGKPLYLPDFMNGNSGERKARKDALHEFTLALEMKVREIYSCLP